MNDEKKIKDAIIKKGLKFTFVANKVGESKQYLHETLKGKIPLKKELKDKLFKILDIK